MIDQGSSFRNCQLGKTSRFEASNTRKILCYRLDTEDGDLLSGDEKEPKEEKVVEKENKRWVFQLFLNMTKRNSGDSFSPKAKTERRNRRKETPRSLKDTEGGEVVLKRAAKN